MSVLFQALGRAAMEGRLQQQPSLVPYLSLEAAARRKSRWLLGAGVMLVLSTSFGGGWATYSYQQRQTVKMAPVVAEHVPPAAVVASVAVPDVDASTPSNAATISEGDVSPKPQKADREAKNYLGSEDIPPDLAQGITLSSTSVASAVPDKDTAAVMQKLQDTPAFADSKNKRKPMKLEVRDTVSPELLKKAHAALVAEDFKGAIALYDQALAESPEHETALAGKGFALQQLGRVEEAVAIQQKLFVKNPNDFSVKSNLVEALASWGTPQAAESLARIVAKQPIFAPAHAALAKIQATTGNETEAVSHLQRAIALEPRNPGYRLSLAILHDRAGRHEQALALYRQVVAMRDMPQTNLPLTWTAIERRIAYLAGKS